MFERSKKIVSTRLLRDYSFVRFCYTRTVRSTIVRSIRKRLTDDNRLALVVLVGTLVLMFVSPFAVFRFVQGNVRVGLIDTSLVIVALAGTIHAWFTGDTRPASMVMTIILAASGVFLSTINGVDGVLWVYPVILFAFYLVKPVFALVIILVGFGVIAGTELADPGRIFDTRVQMISFFSSATTAAVFSFVFALNANLQRERLTRWAIRDPLTGLYNRRHLDEELQIALANRDRYGLEYGLIIFDVDRFKEINDTAGHSTGDRILIDLAALIGGSIRKSDRAFRYGGDEFVILCPGAEREGLRRIAQNLLSAVGATLRWEAGGVTISVGAALLRPEDTQETWNQRADRRLYEAKDRGRNTAVVEE